MSPELVGAFEQQWPEVAKRLQGLLAGKNVPACKREDVVQETGLRLFGMWEKVDRTRPVWPLVVTITLNLLRDEARRNTEREILGAVPEQPTIHDVEHEGLARLEFERVQQAMAQLSPSHRDVLLNEITPTMEVPKNARNATKMMRLRARRALATLLETAVLRAGLVGFKIRQSLGFSDPLIPLRAGAAETGAVPAAALALAALLFGTMHAQPPSIANASEVPDSIAVSPYEADGSAGSSAGGANAAEGDLAVVVQTMRARSLGSALDRDDVGKGKADDRKKSDRDGRRGKDAGRRPNWRAPAPSDAAPIEVPLPVGNAHVGGGVGVGSAGAIVGNRQGSSTPACIAGIEPGSLGCGTEAPKKTSIKAGAEAEVEGQKVEADVDEEVDAGIG